MSAPSESSRAAQPGEALLGRVQQENQKQILGKLLHDLRNPVHSMRIIMELFGRLARREGDIETLIQRAAAYVGPAQAALDHLLTSSERLTTYLGTATAAAIAPLPARAWIEEIALLLRASKRTMQVAVSADVDPALCLLADRPRLSHAALHCCLNNGSAQVALRVREAADALVRIDMDFAADAAARGAGSLRLSAQELRLLIEEAGGTLIAATDGGVSMCFRHSAG